MFRLCGGIFGYPCGEGAGGGRARGEWWLLAFGGERHGPTPNAENVLVETCRFKIHWILEILESEPFRDSVNIHHGQSVSSNLGHFGAGLFPDPILLFYQLYTLGGLH